MWNDKRQIIYPEELVFLFTSTLYLLASILVILLVLNFIFFIFWSERKIWDYKGSSSSLNSSHEDEDG